MITENLSTLKIHKLTQAQYDRELAAGSIDENALYLTPDEEIDLSTYATVEQISTKADAGHTHQIDDLDGILPVDFGGTGATDAATALSNLGAYTKTLLWENASPNSSFAGQYITTLDCAVNDCDGEIGVFDWVEIIFSHGDSVYHTTGALPASGGIYFAQSYKDLGMRYRTFTILGSEFSCEDGHSYDGDSTYENNSCCIPFQVYGIKGGVV